MYNQVNYGALEKTNVSAQQQNVQQAQMLAN